MGPLAQTQLVVVLDLFCAHCKFNRWLKYVCVCVCVVKYKETSPCVQCCASRRYNGYLCQQLRLLVAKQHIFIQRLVF